MTPTVTNPHSLSTEDAAEIARSTLAATAPDARLRLIESKTVEREFGWVFVYAPERFLETRDPRHLVPGDGPLVVQRDDGSTVFLGTSVPPDAAIREFERRWQESRRQR